MLFVLNKDELIIIYIILKYQINKRVIRVILCYLITNWICDAPNPGGPLTTRQPAEYL